MSIFGELRIPLEMSGLVRSDVFRGRGVRRGTGEAVLAIPGLVVGDETMRPLRSWLKRMGYRPLSSGIRVNIQCSEELVASLTERIERAIAIDGRRAHLVGQSRGGMLAHVLAVRRPDLVASVTTLGSPINGTIADFHPLLRRNLTLLSRLGDARSGYIATSCWVGAPGHPVPDTEVAHEHPELLDQDRTRTCCEGFWPDLVAPLPASVSGTAVYSRSDGLLDAHACVAPSYRPVEVRTSHLGMATSSAVYRALADHLGDVCSAEQGRPLRPDLSLAGRRRYVGPPRRAAGRHA